jgi:hypothetical protein
MENAMTRALILGVTALAVSAGAASAQAVYVTPGYGYAPAYVAPAPVYVAPAPVYAAPTVVSPYYAAPTTVTVAPPVYDYAPGYSTIVTEPGW